MNKKALTIIIISVLLLISACESKTTGKRVAIPETSLKAPSTPTGAVAATPPAQTTETGKTAAETLKEIQNNPTPTAGVKSGTFYPPITTTATAEEALKEKTRALFSQKVYVPNVTADSDFGAKYDDSSGDLTNLPGDYSDSSDR